MTRGEKRKIINRKAIDPNCPVDREVINCLHHLAAERHTKAEVLAADLPLNTVKMMRKDIIPQLDFEDKEYVEVTN